MSLNRARSLPLIAAVLVGLGCGDAQLDQSRRQPFFVVQDQWQERAAPGLTLIMPFPDGAVPLQPVGTLAASGSDGSVTSVSVVGDETGTGSNTSLLRLVTAAPGTANIGYRDGSTFRAYASIEVVEPLRWRLDFTVLNQVAPLEGALFVEETVQVLDFTRALAVARIYGRPEFRDVEIIGSGRLLPTEDFLIEVLRDDTPPVRIPQSELPEDQLTSGDLVSILPTGAASGLGLELPNGQTLVSSPVERVAAVDGLQLVVTSTPAQEGRADVAVYGLTESARVIGLSPVVTLDGVPLLAFSGSVVAGGVSEQRVWPWLFSLPDAGATGELEARWQQLSTSIRLGRDGEPPR
ncbi:MAG: hypothetical protein WBM46_10975 [Polyangiales bacterium]|jgi:hypothetical protein